MQTLLGNPSDAFWWLCAGAFSLLVLSFVARWSIQALRNAAMDLSILFALIAAGHTLDALFSLASTEPIKDPLRNVGLVLFIAWMGSLRLPLAFADSKCRLLRLAAKKLNDLLRVYPK